MPDVTYASKEEAKADWYTLPPKYRTKKRLEEMLSRVAAPHAPDGQKDAANASSYLAHSGDAKRP